MGALGQGKGGSALSSNTSAGRLFDGDHQRLQAIGISHQYGGAQALRDVDFEVIQGEVHALIGENGAGKSTLMKVLTGTVRPTSGELRINDVKLHIASPSDAQSLGIGVVHQDYNLFPHLSVAANIVGLTPGLSRNRAVLTDVRALRERASELMDRIGLHLDPKRKAEGLDAAERKGIEIARALAQEPRFLLLDEPTAALEPRETDRLLQVLSTLRDSGTGIILISHRLGEICQVGDRVTVLRDGHTVGQLSKSELTTSTMTKLMVGNDVQEHGGPTNDPGDSRLLIKGLRLRKEAEAVNVEVGRGELVALVGLVGSGCSAVLETAAGVRYDRNCVVQIDGQTHRLRSPVDAIRQSIGYVPEDRKRLGLVLSGSVSENVGLASLATWSKLSFSRPRAMEQSAWAVVDQFDIRLRTVKQAVGSLSGGNQQKVMLARWRLAGSEILVLDEPTQGVDVSARQAIHDYLLDFAAQGGSVLFSSSDIDEVRAIAHRIYVMHAGEVTNEYKNVGPTRPTMAELTEATTVNARASQKATLR